MKIKYSDGVLRAQKKNRPILALESTIISHGMPFPDNLEFAKKAEALCRDSGVEPATIAVLDGTPCVGLSEEQLNKVSNSAKMKKISKNDLGVSLAMRWSGATTVSSTAHIANVANVSVFSTGGIGGVHREAERTFDISQDLTTISKTPIIIVAAGAKSILDIPRTVEALETLGVTTLGYKTDVFPAFFYRDSGVFGPVLVNSSKEIVSVFKKNLELKISSATLVTNPIPRKDEIPKESIDLFIKEAYEQLPEYSISGKDVTPFLLKYIVERSEGKSLQANIALALNNVRVGIKIAKEIVRA